MIHKKIKLSGLTPNDDNPRLLKDSNWLKILNSVKESPAFMELNPIKVDEQMLILGGNQRFRACEFLKWETVPYQVFTKAMAIINNKSRIKNGLSEATYEEQCEEFIIKDNVSYGDWDYDMLANKWDSQNLDHYGVDVWQSKDDFFEVDDLENSSKAKEPKASDDDYSIFELIMKHENKVSFIDLLSKIKREYAFEKQEEALMELIRVYENKK